MSIKNITATAFLILLITAPHAHAATPEQNPFTGIQQSGIAAWNALAEFLGEAWNDAKHLWNSFFGGITDDIGKVLALLISLGEWLWKFVPESLKKFFMAITEFFIRLINLGIDFVKSIVGVFTTRRI